jgi:hypothetical protein
MNPSGRRPTSSKLPQESSDRGEASRSHNVYIALSCGLPKFARALFALRHPITWLTGTKMLLLFAGRHIVGTCAALQIRKICARRSGIVELSAEP